MADDLNLDVLQALSKPFDSGDVKEYTKEWTRNGKQYKAGPFHYIPDENVMDRLDGAAGPGNWMFEVEPVPGQTCVKGTLGVRWPESGAFVVYSDFGYPTRDDSAEPLKEAVSDVLRRLGRFVGVARYVYKGELDASKRVSSTPASAPARSKPAAAASDDDFDMSEIDGDENRCAQHGVEWRRGNDGGRYHKAGEREDGKAIWCRHPADVKPRS